jgi:hypothetical protein
MGLFLKDVTGRGRFTEKFSPTHSRRAACVKSSNAVTSASRSGGGPASASAHSDSRPSSVRNQASRCRRVSRTRGSRGNSRSSRQSFQKHASSTDTRKERQFKPALIQKVQLERRLDDACGLRSVVSVTVDSGKVKGAGLCPPCNPSCIQFSAQTVDSGVDC